MLRIQLNMNSAVEAVLNFKTCCNLQAQDQNLEILVHNEGDDTVELPAHFDLQTEERTVRVQQLVPVEGIRVEAGQVQAFYCQMDEELWAKASRVVMFDRSGGFYPVAIEHALDEHSD